MRTAPFNLERAQKVATGEMWSIQHRQEAPPMAYFGESPDAVKGASSFDGAEAICTMNNLFMNLVLDAMAAEDWKNLALQFASTIIVKIPEGGRCNACGLINAHLPSCPVVPHLKQLAELFKKERHELRV